MGRNSRESFGVEGAYNYRVGSSTADAVAERFINELFGSRQILRWVGDVRQEAIDGALVNTRDGQDGVEMLPVMLASKQPLIRDTACASVVKMLYENNLGTLRERLATAGFHETVNGQAAGNPRYTLLDVGDRRTGGGVSMQEGIMITDESVSPPRVTILYRGTKDAEDRGAHLRDLPNFAGGNSLEGYRNDNGLLIDVSSQQFVERAGQQLVDVTHPLIIAEIERLQAAYGRNQVAVTAYGHSLGADPAAIDAAFLSQRFPGLEVDWVGAAPISSFTPEERAFLSSRISGREMEIYNENDPLNSVSNFLRGFNHMDSLGSGSTQGSELRINVPAFHDYENSLFLEALRVAALERRRGPGGEQWFCSFMRNFGENGTAEEREAAVRELVQHTLGQVNDAYCEESREWALMRQSLADYANPQWAPATSTPDEGPVAPTYVAVATIQSEQTTTVGI